MHEQLLELKVLFKFGAVALAQRRRAVVDLPLGHHLLVEDLLRFYQLLDALSANRSIYKFVNCLVLTSRGKNKKITKPHRSSKMSGRRDAHYF